MERHKEYVRDLLCGVVDDPEQVLYKCELFIQELLKWNVSINLTSITDPVECWEKHIQDSLLLVQYVQYESNLLDMGSGAGLPSIPLKICCPEIEITSVDKVRKKINFQKHCKRMLGLEKLNPVNDKLGSNVKVDKKFDVVTARALAPLADLIETGSPHLKSGGLLLAMKSKVGDEEMNAGRIAAVAANLELKDIVECRLLPSGAIRQLILFRKKNYTEGVENRA